MSPSVQVQAPVGDQLRGITAMTVASIFFVLNDTMTKLAGSVLPVGEVIAIRGVFGSVLILALILALRQHRSVRQLAHPAMVWRTLAEIGGSVLFVTALVHMPLTNITAVIQALPLAVAAAGAIFLGERVGWRRWLAILAGFAGVLIVLRPGGEGFNIYGLMVLGSVCCVCLREIVTRRMPRGMPSVLVAAVAAIATTLLGLGLGLGETWVAPGIAEVLYCAGAGVFLTAGQWLAVVAVRNGSLSIVSLFRYASIIWAILLGYLIWSDVPDLPTLAGALLIVATGIYTFHRERRLARAAARTVET